MRRDGLRAQGWAGAGSDVAVLGDEALDRVVAEMAAEPAGKQRRAGSVVVFTEPGVKNVDGLGRQGVIRSLRPLPWQRTWGPASRCWSSPHRRVTSEIGTAWHAN